MKNLPLILISMALGMVVFLGVTKIVIHLADDENIRVEYPLRRLLRRDPDARKYEWLARLITCKLELMGSTPKEGW